MHLKKINQKGIGLVEVIAALGISVVVITSLVSLSLFTLRSSLESKLLLEGTKVANRELELVRAYRDSSDVWVDENDFPAAGDSGRAFLNNIDTCNSVTNMCHIDSSSFSVVTGVGTSGTGAEVVKWGFYVTQAGGGPIQKTDQAVRISVEANWLVGGQNKYARLYTDLTNWSGN